MRNCAVCGISSHTATLIKNSSQYTKTMFRIIKANIRCNLAAHRMVFILYNISMIASLMLLLLVWVYAECMKTADNGTVENRAFTVTFDESVSFSEITRISGDILSDTLQSYRVYMPENCLNDDRIVQYSNGYESGAGLNDTLYYSKSVDAYIGDSCNAPEQIMLGSDSYVMGQYKIGDTIECFGKNYTVCGFVLESFNVVSLPPADISINKIDFIAEKLPNISEAEAMSAHLQNAFSDMECSVSVPPKINTDTDYITSSLAIIFIIISVFAFLNVSFLYKYIIEKRRKNYAIFRLCGCQAKTATYLLIGELFILYVFEYLVSVLLFKLFFVDILFKNVLVVDKIQNEILTMNNLMKMFVFSLLAFLIAFIPVFKKLMCYSPKELYSK